jgi:hypothetical protein
MKKGTKPVRSRERSRFTSRPLVSTAIWLNPTRSHHSFSEGGSVAKKTAASLSPATGSKHCQPLPPGYTAPTPPRPSTHCLSTYVVPDRAPSWWGASLRARRSLPTESGGSATTARTECRALPTLFFIRVHLCPSVAKHKKCASAPLRLRVNPNPARSHTQFSFVPSLHRIRGYPCLLVHHSFSEGGSVVKKQVASLSPATGAKPCLPLPPGYMASGCPQPLTHCHSTSVVPDGALSWWGRVAPRAPQLANRRCRTCCNAGVRSAAPYQHCFFPCSSVSICG